MGVVSTYMAPDAVAVTVAWVSQGEGTERAAKDQAVRSTSTERPRKGRGAGRGEPRRQKENQESGPSACN